MRQITSISALLIVLGLAGCGSSGGDGGGLLDLNGSSGSTSSPTTLKLALSCPNGISPGSTVDGFLATLTDGGGKAVSGIFVSLTTTQGTIDAPPDMPSSFGANTSSKGEVPFALRAPSDAGVGSTITIRANVKTDKTTATQSCQVPVRANNFVLTKPQSNSTQSVGLMYAQPVQLNWTTASGTGVKGTVTLTANNRGTFTFDTTQQGSSPASADTNENGQLVNTIYFVCGDATFTTITAQAASDTTLRDSQTVQCVDAPAYGQLTATPSTVKASASDPAAFPKLSYIVYSSSNKPLAKQSVTFELTKAAGGGDKVTPTTGVTDSSGTATAQYQPGTSTGTVTVRACVAQDSNTCDSRTITVN